MKNQKKNSKYSDRAEIWHGHSPRKETSANKIMFKSGSYSLFQSFCKLSKMHYSTQPKNALVVQSHPSIFRSSLTPINFFFLETFIIIIEHLHTNAYEMLSWPGPLSVPAASYGNSCETEKLIASRL